MELMAGENEFPAHADAYIECFLGDVACGGAEVTQHAYNMLAWASTWKKTPGVAVWLTVDGGGSFKRGDEFPNLFILNCLTIVDNTCSDSEAYAHTCAYERNAMSIFVTHSAGIGDAIYVGMGSSDKECPGPIGGGGSGEGGGLDCSTEHFIVEAWNEETGMWDYHSTVTGTVCV